MGIFSAGMNLAGTLMSANVGRKQMKEGEAMIGAAQKLADSYKRPKMLTPDAINNLVSFTQGQMYKRLPGATNYENMIKGSTASGMSAIESMGAGSEGIGALASMIAGEQSAFGNLAAQEAGFQQSAASNYGSALESLAGFEQDAWQWNEADPYLAAMQKANQLDMYGRMNQFAGYKTKAGVWAEGLKGLGGELDDADVGGMLKGAGGMLRDLFSKISFGKKDA